MDKIKDLLSDLEKKVESNLNELLSLREQNNELLDKNKSLINERNDLMLDLESLEENNLDRILQDAFRAAEDRSIEISNEK